MNVPAVVVATGSLNVLLFARGFVICLKGNGDLRGFHKTMLYLSDKCV